MHIDVDAFFASVEQLLIPRLRGREVIVGSGCIASCSYEARRFGLRAGMPLHEARRQRPSAVILPGDYQIYRCFAEQIWNICRRYTDSLETFLDEAYGRIAVDIDRYGGPDQFGLRIQHEVADEVRLPVSIGLATNRMMAKFASSAAKPAGVLWIPAGIEADYLAPLPVRDLPGVGPKIAARLAEMNIATIGQLAALPARALATMFGRVGLTMHDRACGQDDQSVRPTALPRSISRETTFHTPTCDRDVILGMINYLLQRAMRAMRSYCLLAGCVELSIRYDDWKHTAARRSLDEPTSQDSDVAAVVAELFDRLHHRRIALRHVGIMLSGFTQHGSRPSLLPPARSRSRNLQHVIDNIRDRFGHASVIAGPEIDLLGKCRQNDYGFVLRTPSLTK